MAPTARGGGGGGGGGGGEDGGAAPPDGVSSIRNAPAARSAPTTPVEIATAVVVGSSGIATLLRRNSTSSSLTSTLGRFKRNPSRGTSVIAPVVSWRKRVRSGKRQV